MKKFLTAVFTLLLGVVITNSIIAQDSPTVEGPDTMTQVVENNDPATEENNTASISAEDTGKKEKKYSMHQTLKKNFIDGGWQFMAIVLVCLILGLAVAIERIITLSLATVNTKKLVESLDQSIASGDIAGARETCRSTAGPTAEVLGEGLKRVDEGIDSVEKAIVANGSVQMGLLEKGLVWLSLFIALAPMLGFMGTVIGMIDAFTKIEEMGDIQASAVAGGIKIALLTTVFGLITAIILQIFYNYITSKVDSLVNNMEDATISIIDSLIDNGYAQSSAATENGGEA